ncbi:MAG: P63C domain-containing protein [Phycisphaerae bacterium]|nr:P63C domain-containing protein [Phycisphaerae bacterium]
MKDRPISDHASKGGKARAEHLTPEERSAIARQAVKARWERAGKLKPIMRATHGSPDHPLRIGELEIPCYVLEDGRRVLVQKGMMTGLGMSQGTASKGVPGDRLGKFIEGKSLSPFISKHLYDVITKPIVFRTPLGSVAYGYEATVLADLCDAVLAARKAKKLNYQQEHIAEQCEILVRGFARVGIIALVDEATGYQDDRARDALAKILESFVAKEIRKWVKTFPSDFYKEMFRLRGLPYGGKLKTPSYIGHLTNDLVYSRLAPGILDELKRKNPVDEHGRRKHKHHQWLTEEIGHPKLLQHLFAVTILMKAHDDWDTFHEKLDRTLPKYIPMPLFEQAGVSME